MISMDEIKERVILVAVDTDGSDQAERSLDELGELAKTAGAEVVGRMIQPRENIHPGTYIGKGKILELKELLWETHGTGIICDDELTSVQMGNLEAELDCKIMDRTLLILDIFAARAVSGEGFNTFFRLIGCLDMKSNTVRTGIDKFINISFRLIYHKMYIKKHICILA